MSISKSLTAKRKAKIFVEAYIANGGNARRAAITAGYSAKSAAVAGNRLLNNVYVSDLLTQRSESLAKKYELTTELAVRSIVQELTFDPAKLYNGDGTLKSVTELDEDTRMALASLEVEHLGSADAPVTVRKIKWASRSQAREQAMKHLGMFERDNAQRAIPVTLTLNMGGIKK